VAYLFLVRRRDARPQRVCRVCTMARSAGFRRFTLWMADHGCARFGYSGRWRLAVAPMSIFSTTPRFDRSSHISAALSDLGHHYARPSRFFSSVLATDCLAIAVYRPIGNRCCLRFLYRWCSMVRRIYSRILALVRILVRSPRCNVSWRSLAVMRRLTKRCSQPLAVAMTSSQHVYENLSFVCRLTM
jgi:hypothetical protein